METGIGRFRHRFVTLVFMISDYLIDRERFIKKWTNALLMQLQMLNHGTILLLHKSNDTQQMI